MRSMACVEDWMGGGGGGGGSQLGRDAAGITDYSFHLFIVW